MKNNDTFDNKLRDKLHDFEPDFEEKAWRNFAPSLQQVSQVNRFARYKKYIAYAASVSLFLTAAAYMGYQNYRLSDTNKALKEKNTAYQNLIEQEKRKKQSSSEREEAKKQTNFDAQVNSALEKEKNTPVSPSVKEKEEKTIPYNNKDTKVVEKGNGTKLKELNPSPEVEKSVAHAPKSQNKKANSEFKRERVSEKAPESDVVNVIIKFKNKANDSLITLQPTKNVIVNSPNEKENSKQVKEEKNAIVNNIVEPKKAIFDINAIQHKAEKWNFVAASPKISLQKTLDFPVEKYKMGIYAGAMTTVSKGITGVGGMVSLAFAPHWSANVGIETSRQMQRRFEDEEDFKEQIGEDFSQVLPIPVSSGTSFSEIAYSKSSISLPVGLQYNKKLLPHLSLVAGIGTRILLDSKQRFQYHYEEPGQGSEEHENEFHHRPPMNSHSQRFPVIASVGLQANIKRWQFQATPYYMASLPDAQNPQMPSANLDRKTPFVVEFRLMRRF